MEHRDQDNQSRRQFLKGASAAGAGLVAGTVAAAPAANASVVSGDAAAVSPGGYLRVNGAPPSRIDFGRMFPALPPFAEANDTVRAALMELGTAGGILDARDQLAAGPKSLILDPTVNGNPTAADPYGTNPDNPTMTAGSTFVGQFTDHDITFDQTSQARRPAEPAASPLTPVHRRSTSTRSSAAGPSRRPDLYVSNPDGSVGPKLHIGSGGVHEDVPESPTATAPTRPCSATLATTRTSSSPGCTAPTSPSTTGSLDELARARPRPVPDRSRLGGEPLTRLPGAPARPPGHPVALPVASGQRAPPSDRRPVDGGRRALERQSLLPTPRRATRSCPSSSAPPPTASATAWSVPRTGRTSRAATGDSAAPAARSVLRARFRRRTSRFRRTRRTTIATICSGDTRRRDATSAGRRSSTSATARSRTTRRSTRRSRAFSSPSRCPRSRPTPSPHPPCCRSATCCAS